MFTWLVAGDWHGSLVEAVTQLRIAQQVGASRIVQVGDFGFGMQEKFITNVQREAQKFGIPIDFVDGNHENFAKLLQYPLNAAGVRPIGPWLRHLPRAYAWEVDGVRFAAMGGAISVDKEWRIDAELAGNRPKSWWSEEEQSPGELERFEALGKIDVLFTHDCASTFPFSAMGGPFAGAKGPVFDQANRHHDLLSRAAIQLQPQLWFHGHMHYACTYWYPEYGDHSIRVESLGSNYDSRASMVLTNRSGFLEAYYPKVAADYGN